MEKTTCSGLLTRFYLVPFVTVGILLSLTPFKKLEAQSFEPYVGVGLTNYFGDLASYDFADGFDILFGGAVHGGLKYYPNRTLDIRAGFQFTMLRGDDAISSKESIRNRNLSFRAPVFQFESRLEWNILGFIPGDPTDKFTPFISAGIGIMRFNPQANYAGTWYDLQPLGTEGQGLSRFPEKEYYQRVQVYFPAGAGLKFNISGQVTLTLEATWHLTGTDYLDDVGGTSVTYPVLLEEKGELTAALANRTGEYLGTGPVVVPTGSRRGNPDTNDSYFTGMISIGYAFSRASRFGGGPRIKCPKF